MSESFPYQDLLDQQFEELCYDLLRNENSILEPHFFARAGQAQHGVDLTATTVNNKFNVYQCKHYMETPFTESLLRSWLDKFNHEWLIKKKLPRPSAFFLLISRVIGKDKTTHEMFLRTAEAFKEEFRTLWGDDITIDF